MKQKKPALLGMLLVLGLLPISGQQQPSPGRVINIAAERFSFTPSTITVDQGASVELRITSDDTDHGFRLVGPAGKEIDVTIPKRGRGEARVRLDTSEPGEYRFECSLICGAGHSFMRGTVRVRARETRTAPAETR